MIAIERAKEQIKRTDSDRNLLKALGRSKQRQIKTTTDQKNGFIIDSQQRRADELRKCSRGKKKRERQKHRNKKAMRGRRQ